MSCRVLVTGGSGFLGCYVARFLVNRGDTVVNYDIRPTGLEMSWLLGDKRTQICFERGNVEDLAGLISVCQKHDIDRIVHTAAIVDPPYLLNHPVEAYRVNIGGTLNVLESARILELAKVVYISSNGVFTAKRYEPIDEEHPVLLPNEGPGNGPYSISKVASEAFGLSYHNTFGLDFVALRPSAVYGFGMQYPMFIKPMIENSLRGLPTRFEVGRDLPRDYTYVEDVVQAVIRALDISHDKLEDRIFLIATGQKLITPGELEMVVKDLVPGSDIEVGPGLSDWNKKEIKYRGMINISRARQQLGYEPKYDIKTGIAEFIELYCQYITNEEGKVMGSHLKK
jgi:nucleoside-diphosphate-sugar epimerase